MTLRFAESNPNMISIICSGEPIVGFIVGVITNRLFSSITEASAADFVVLPEHRGVGARLLKAYLKWAKENGASIAHANITSGYEVDRTGKFYERLGFEKTGTNYRIEL